MRCARTTVAARSAARPRGASKHHKSVVLSRAVFPVIHSRYNLMFHKKSVLTAAAALLAAAVACSKSPSSPVAPGASSDPASGAAADGSTLKSATPSTVSPTGGTQVTDPVIFTA